MPALLLILVIGLVGALAYLSYQAKQKRRQELFTLATSLGLQFSIPDPFDLAAKPFRLLGMGDGRGCENVMWGARGDLPIVAFDYWYYEESTDTKGHTSRSYRRFSCAIVKLPLWGPHLVLGRETLLSRIGDAIGFDDIEFESEEFNQAWRVNCDDARYASYVVDARMMEWLLGAQGWQFELNGDELLSFCDRLDTGDVPSLMQVIASFRSQIPRAAIDVYQKG